MKKFVIENLMSRSRSIISLPKSSWATSTQRNFFRRFWPIKLQEEFNIITQYKCHHWMLRTISRWILIIRGWWITVQKLHKKEENFDNMYVESSKPTVDYHEYGSQDSNNVETKVEPSGMRRETVACTKRENPGSSKAAAAAATAAAILHRLHPRKKSMYQKEIHREDRIWDYSFWMTDVQKTHHWYSHLQVRMIRHHGESKRKGVHTLFWQEDSWEVYYELERVILPVLRRRLGKNSCMRIDCIASTAEDSKQDLKSVKMQTKN